MVDKTTHQLINIIHHNKAKYHEQWFKKGQCILIVEKVRLPNGKVVKRLVKKENPTIIYHVTSDQYKEEHEIPELAYPASQCDEYESPVEKLNLHIAQLTDQMAYFNETKGPGANQRRKKLHDHRWLHGSDLDLVDSYIDRFIEHYSDSIDKISPLDVAFADIEVDPVEHIGFPEEDDAPCPINLISYFHQPSKKLTQFILMNSVQENPQIQEFFENYQYHQLRLLGELNRAVLLKLKDSEGNNYVTNETPWEDIIQLLGFIESETIPCSEEAQKLARCHELEFKFYDTELEVIRAFLHTVNEIDRPDVITFWNMKFDIKTIMNRLLQLGCDPEAEFTPIDFKPWEIATYQEDTHSTEPSNNSDVFLCSSYTIYIDQMLLYAQLRKTSGKKESYSLDFTLNAEINEHKFEYEGNLRDLAYRNFPDFILYGAFDVVPMATLEEKTNDIALAYQLSMITRTRIHKIMKKTICLRNLAAVFYRDYGLILSNNRNRNKFHGDKEKFRGGFVADPKLMEETGILIDGKKSDRVFDNVVDFDATSLYPSIIMTFNIDNNGQIGRLITQDENGVDVDASLLVEAWSSGDPIEIGKNWLNLPGLGELYQNLLDT
jgi:hypothetical protein